MARARRRRGRGAAEGASDAGGDADRDDDRDDVVMAAAARGAKRAPRPRREEKVRADGGRDNPSKQDARMTCIAAQFGAILFLVLGPQNYLNPAA